MDPNQLANLPNQPERPSTLPPQPNQTQPQPGFGSQLPPAPGQVAGVPPASQPQQLPPIQPSYPNPPFPQVGSVPSYPQQPMSASQLQSGSSSSKKIFVIIAVVVSLAILGGVAVMLTSGGDSNPISDITNKITGGADVIDRSDGTLDLGNLIDRQETIKDQELKAGLNQQLNLSDGISYMVTGVERNFSGESRYLQPDADKEFIKVNIVVGNRNQDRSEYISKRFFKIKNSAGGLQSPIFVSQSDLPDAFTGSSVDAGKQLKGVLVYEINKDEPITVLVTESEYKSLLATDKDVRVSVKSEVTLQ